MNMGVTMTPPAMVGGAGAAAPGALGGAPMMGAQGGMLGSPIGQAGNVIKGAVKSVFANDQVANGILQTIGKPPIPAANPAASSLGGGFQNAMGGIGQVAEGVAKGGLFGAAGEGIFSAITNGLKVFKHEETLPVAGGNVAADAASGAVAGTASALASGAAMAGLAGFAGMAGAPLFLIGGAIGLGVFFLADKFFHASPFFQMIKSKVTALLGGH